MGKSLFFSTLLTILSIGFCSSCSNPDVTSTSFTTLDATIVSSIGYISEFTVKCNSGQLGSLYAEFDGNVVPVSIVGPNKFQVSWTEESKTAQSGDRLVRIFDEEGYTTFRKTSRAGEDVSLVPSLFNVVINHPGAFNGPWLQSEFVATVLSLVAAYFAVVSRSKVLS